MLGEDKKNDQRKILVKYFKGRQNKLEKGYSQDLVTVEGGGGDEKIIRKKQQPRKLKKIRM